MRVHSIDNSLKNLGKTVLWQYDRAIRLLSVMKHMQVMFYAAIERFWGFWLTKILSIDTAGAMGCGLWGQILGVARPSIKLPSGEEIMIADVVYRKLLKGTFYLMNGSSNFDTFYHYCEIIFSIDGKNTITKWMGSVSEYGWYTNIEELNNAYRPNIAYYIGDVIWNQDEPNEYGNNWKFKKEVPLNKNTSWESIRDSVEPTQEETTSKTESESLLLKLYDPEGQCRKIAGAPKDALEIKVEYRYGSHIITAKVQRRRKCGVMVVDLGNMAMEYRKTEYYDEMHAHQRALFEQKADVICPYPLGIKNNDKAPEWVLGCKGQENRLYEKGVAYSKGEIFGVIDENGDGQNYKCIEDISEVENTGFENIGRKLQKTKDGDPFVGTMIEREDIRYQAPVTRPGIVSASNTYILGEDDGRQFIYETITKQEIVEVVQRTLPDGQIKYDPIDNSNKIVDVQKLQELRKVSSEEIKTHLGNTTLSNITHKFPIMMSTGNIWEYDGTYIEEALDWELMHNAYKPYQTEDGESVLITQFRVNRKLKFFRPSAFENCFVWVCSRTTSDNPADIFILKPLPEVFNLFMNAIGKVCSLLGWTKIPYSQALRYSHGARYVPYTELLYNGEKVITPIESPQVANLESLGKTTFISEETQTQVTEE